MCGIFGYIGININKSNGEIHKFKKSLNIISHRGPDNFQSSMECGLL